MGERGTAVGGSHHCDTDCGFDLMNSHSCRKYVNTLLLHIMICTLERGQTPSQLLLYCSHMGLSGNTYRLVKEVTRRVCSVKTEEI